MSSAYELGDSTHQQLDDLPRHEAVKHIGRVSALEQWRQDEHKKDIEISIPNPIDVEYVNINTVARFQDKTYPLHFDKQGFVTTTKRYDLPSVRSRQVFNLLLQHRVDAARNRRDDGVPEITINRNIFTDVEPKQRHASLLGVIKDINDLLPDETPLIIFSDSSKRAFNLNPRVTLHPIAEPGIDQLSPIMVERREQSLTQLTRAHTKGVRQTTDNESPLQTRSENSRIARSVESYGTLLENFFSGKDPNVPMLDSFLTTEGRQEVLRRAKGIIDREYNRPGVDKRMLKNRVMMFKDYIEFL